MSDPCSEYALASFLWREFDMPGDLAEFYEMCDWMRNNLRRSRLRAVPDTLDPLREHIGDLELELAEALQRGFDLKTERDRALRQRDHARGLAAALEAEAAL